MLRRARFRVVSHVCEHVGVDHGVDLVVESRRPVVVGIHVQQLSVRVGPDARDDRHEPRRAQSLRQGRRGVALGLPYELQIDHRSVGGRVGSGPPDRGHPGVGRGQADGADAGGARADEAAFRTSAREILELLGLGELADIPARSLPHGHLRALGIAISLAARPRVVLLDEPFAGMNPEETDRAVEMVRAIRDRGITVLLVEHDMRAVMRISDRGAGAQLRPQDRGGGARRHPARRSRDRSLSRTPGRRAGRLMSYFRADNLYVNYDQVRAISGVSVALDEGDIVALIGANGAGKTTTLRAIAGLAPLAAGEIELDGQRLDGMRPHAIVALGVAMVPEGRRVFPFLSVVDNLLMGAFLRRDRAAIGADMERVFERFPRLRERRTQTAGTMSGGEQQMLAIGRALMARPRLLLLDEPSLGLAPMLVQEIARAIVAINQEDGVSLILVEQNSRMALRVSKRTYALEIGRVALEGASRDLVNDDRIRELYLGG